VRRSLFTLLQFERAGIDVALSALRNADGDARSCTRLAVEAGSILGLSSVWPSFLDHLPRSTCFAEVGTGRFRDWSLTIVDSNNAGNVRIARFHGPIRLPT
jgi:hypothetical protein